MSVRKSYKKTHPEKPGRGVLNTINGDTMVRGRNKDREFRVIYWEFPISFWFASAFPCNRMRKLRGLGVRPVLWLDRLCRIVPNDSRLVLFERA